MGPPSPDFSINMDCAFPPFPSSATASPRRTKSKHREKLEPSRPKYAEGNSMYAPLSPRHNAGQNVTKRMDTIAPGPFDGRGGDGRPSTSDGRNSTANRASMASTRSRSSTFSSRSVGLPSNPRQGAEFVPPVPPLVPQSPEPATEGIDAFLSRLQRETMQPRKANQDSRSKTHPIRQESEDKAQPSSHQRRPSVPYAPTKPPVEQRPVLSHSPPRGPLRTRSPLNVLPKSSADSGSALPPPATPAYALGLPSKPAHAPSVSGLSDESLASSGFRSIASPRSSPATSMDSSQYSRDASKMDQAGFVPGEPIPRVESPDSFMDPRTPPRPKGAKAPGPVFQPPALTFADTPPESPLDPAIQHGLFPPLRPSESKLNRIDSPIDMDVASAAPKVPEPETRQQPDRRPPPNRGKCRGCSEPIVGKSVKDASGRLTGRYHKQCFVCRTCQSPFPSAEFYVFNNAPYCEHHYHELNGSLCRACNRGIEGQYLETDQRWKFHPRCFSCLTCRVVLRDDYYEVGGKAYCERHAYAAQKSMRSLGPPGNNRFLPTNNLQKRRTRLMMMM